MTVSIPGKSYKATGITLKSSPMGESDRLLTILTKEHGVVRVVTPGCRKPKSSLRAISSAFVTGELLIIKGRNLDKLVQADCRGSFPALSRDLGKLTAAQYLAELILSQALSEHPQAELFHSFQQHLAELSQRPAHQTLPYLVYSIFTILVSAGVAPQLQHCGVSRKPLTPDLVDDNYQVDFDIAAGQATQVTRLAAPSRFRATASDQKAAVSEQPGQYAAAGSPSWPQGAVPQQSRPVSLTALQLWVLQQLSHLAGAVVDASPATAANTNGWLDLDDLLDAHLINLEYLQQQVILGISDSAISHQAGAAVNHKCGNANENESADDDYFLDEIFPINHNLWLTLERLLRQYCHYHFDQPIRSAALIETCFPEKMN